MIFELTKLQDKRLKIISTTLFAGVVITIIKFIAFFITNSNAIYTDALENIINVLASAFAFYSIYLAALPKDKNHPYGHGKVEFFAVGFEGAMIIIAAVNIIYNSINSVINPEPIKDIDHGMILIILAGLLNFILGYYLIRKSKELKSITLEADGKHLMVDAYTSAGLLGGLALIYITEIYVLDAIISFVLALLILYNGYKLLRKSISGLMDESDIALVHDIVKILNIHRKSEWIDVHNLRVQKYGSDLHIDCHLTLPFYYDLNRVHDEVQQLHELIEKEADATVEIFIHADPCLSECCMYCSVVNCDKRTSEKIIDIKFDIDNIVNNAKHFASHAKI